MKWQIVHRSRARKASIFAFLAVLSGALSALKAEVAFTGVVEDAVTEQPVSGVSLFVGVDAGLGETDDSGAFSFHVKEAGTFDVRAFKIGYQLAFVKGIEFREGTPTELVVKLLPLGGAIELMRDPNEPLEAIAEGTGAVVGRIRDSDTERGVESVAVELRAGAAYASTTPAEKILRVFTDADGEYRFDDVDSGYYSLHIEMDGYRTITLEDIAVKPGEDSEWNVPLVPLAEDSEVYELGEFVVSAEKITKQQFDFQVLRQQSINLVDLFSAEDFAKFAASDVGEAIQRIPGITVEGGKFAVIRGLNERYSSTLLNGAPVPSPDPDRQSVPLDLFPSEIVNNLVVSKTFSASDPGNSAGGSLNILTHIFPDEFTVKLSVGTGTNSVVQDRFLTDGGRKELTVDFGKLGENKAVAIEAITNNQITPTQEAVPLDLSYSLELGGTYERWNRKLRYVFNFRQEWDYSGSLGVEEDRFAVRPSLFFVGTNEPPNPVIIGGDGDLALRRLSATTGRYDLTESAAEKSTSGLGILELELDRDGHHKVGYTGFYIETKLDRATLRNNGHYLDTTEEELRRQNPEEPLILASGGFDAFNALRFWETNLVNETRELTIHQINGSHEFGQASVFKAKWLLSTSETSQIENNSISASGWTLPDGTQQTGNNTEFTQSFVPTSSWRKTSEKQDFGRLDLDYRWDVTNDLTITPQIGVFAEDTRRSIGQEFFVYNLTGVSIDEANFYDGYDTIEEAVGDHFADIRINVPPGIDLDSSRKVNAHYAALKFSIFEKLDIVPGVRFEKLKMTTATGEGDFFNYSLLRDSSSLAVTPTPPQENAAILGLPSVLPTDFKGVIDEDLVLPTVNLSLQATDKFRILVGYSQTVARPSFKEFAYITTRDPVTLDYASGNPSLTISHITSVDLRLEYVFNDEGDLLAISGFRKKVEDPIEKVTLQGLVLTDTYFNNPNEADLQGIEFEVRKSLATYFEEDSFFSHFSIGGNVALIDATVDIPDSFRSMLAEGLLVNVSGSTVRRGGGYYAVEGPTVLEGDIGEAPTKRSLFDQPRWIANGDITFDHEDWGTRITLSAFAQSQVLDAAGGYLSGTLYAIPDRYRTAFHRLDFSLRQRVKEHFNISFSAKNLTDSNRGTVYDENAVAGSVKNREFRVGRSYSLSLTWNY